MGILNVKLKFDKHVSVHSLDYTNRVAEILTLPYRTTMYNNLPWIRSSWQQHQRPPRKTAHKILAHLPKHNLGQFNTL